VGANYSDKLIVDEGLKAGETVVVDGQLRLFPGARVQVVPAASIDSKPL
jgi:multidrug efflux pump subunit AcrA (membrane-fusion protein)